MFKHVNTKNTTFLGIREYSNDSLQPYMQSFNFHPDSACSVDGHGLVTIMREYQQLVTQKIQTSWHFAKTKMSVQTTLFGYCASGKLYDAMGEAGWGITFGRNSLEMPPNCQMHWKSHCIDSCLVYQNTLVYLIYTTLFIYTLSPWGPTQQMQLFYPTWPSNRHTFSEKSRTAAFWQCLQPRS